MPSAAAMGARRPGAARGRRAAAGCRVFIDFDNTITVGDVLDGLIERFSPGDGWRALEEAWTAGRISTRECLEGQLRGIRARWEDLAPWLDHVDLDPGFRALHDLAATEGIELTVVSDNFDRLIGRILHQHGLAGVAVRANHVDCLGDRLIPSFPFANPACAGCAHCKRVHFTGANADGRATIYLGDGRSDLCPARHADLVFAKAGLLAGLRREGIACIPFRQLADAVPLVAAFLYDHRH